MPFQKLLDRMRSLRGVESVALLDSEGELIFHSGGDSPDRLRVVGAYQGIFISSVSNLGIEPPRTLCTLYSGRAVLTRALKDGYFICVIGSPDLNFAHAQFVFEDIYNRLEAEL